MARIPATSRPCHHNRFPIRLVRRPSPSGTPSSRAQTSRPETALMNWRWPEFIGVLLVFLQIVLNSSVDEISLLGYGLGCYYILRMESPRARPGGKSWLRRIAAGQFPGQPA